MLQESTIRQLGFVGDVFYEDVSKRIDQLGWQIFVLLEKTCVPFPFSRIQWSRLIAHHVYSGREWFPGFLSDGERYIFAVGHRNHLGFLELKVVDDLFLSHHETIIVSVISDFVSYQCTPSLLPLLIIVTTVTRSLSQSFPWASGRH